MKYKPRKVNVICGISPAEKRRLMGRYANHMQDKGSVVFLNTRSWEYAPNGLSNMNLIDEDGIDTGYRLYVKELVKGRDCVFVSLPETGLHALDQQKATDFLLKICKNKTLFIETNSMIIVRRLQRRVAEGIVSVNDIQFLICRDRTVVCYELNEDAMFPGYPAEFNDTDFNEIAAIDLANMKRKVKESRP